MVSRATKRKRKETSKKLRALQRARWLDPAYVEKVTASMKRAAQDPEIAARRNHALRTIYYRRYPWCPPERHADLKKLIQRWGKEMGVQMMREELGL